LKPQAAEPDAGVTIMKNVFLPAALLFSAFAAANSYAADAVQNPAGPGARTRAEVKAELAQAQREGQLATAYATYPSLVVVNAAAVQKNGSIVLTQRRAGTNVD
jgi:hypothetical protein